MAPHTPPVLDVSRAAHVHSRAGIARPTVAAASHPPQHRDIPQRNTAAGLRRSNGWPERARQAASPLVMAGHDGRAGSNLAPDADHNLRNFTLALFREISAGT